MHQHKYGRQEPSADCAAQTNALDVKSRKSFYRLSINFACLYDEPCEYLYTLFGLKPLHQWWVDEDSFVYKISWAQFEWLSPRERYDIRARRLLTGTKSFRNVSQKWYNFFNSQCSYIWADVIDVWPWLRREVRRHRRSTLYKETPSLLTCSRKIGLVTYRKRLIISYF